MRFRAPKCRPSVVNIANVALLRNYFTTDIEKIPQVCGRFRRYSSGRSHFVHCRSMQNFLTVMLCAPSQAADMTLHCSCLCVQGQGSGFIWDNQGHIVTNFHVIRGAAEVQVTLIDQSKYTAKFIGGELVPLLLSLLLDVLRAAQPGQIYSQLHRRWVGGICVVQ